MVAVRPIRGELEVRTRCHAAPSELCEAGAGLPDLFHIPGGLELRSEDQLSALEVGDESTALPDPQVEGERAWLLKARGGVVGPTEARAVDCPLNSAIGGRLGFVPGPGRWVERIAELGELDP